MAAGEHEAMEDVPRRFRWRVGKPGRQRSRRGRISLAIARLPMLGTCTADVGDGVESYLPGTASHV